MTLSLSLSLFLLRFDNTQNNIFWLKKILILNPFENIIDRQPSHISFTFDKKKLQVQLFVTLRRYVWPLSVHIDERIEKNERELIERLTILEISFRSIKLRHWITLKLPERPYLPMLCHRVFVTDRIAHPVHIVSRDRERERNRLSSGLCTRIFRFHVHTFF